MTAMSLPPLGDFGVHEWVRDQFGSGDNPDWELNVDEYPADKDGPASLDASVSDPAGFGGWGHVTPAEVRKIADDYEKFPGVLREFAIRIEAIQADFDRRHGYDHHEVAEGEDG